jgi:hypothetical protein
VEAAPAAEAGSEPEVIKKGKKDEEAAAGEAAATPAKTPAAKAPAAKKK